MKNLTYQSNSGKTIYLSFKLFFLYFQFFYSVYHHCTFLLCFIKFPSLVICCSEKIFLTLHRKEMAKWVDIIFTILIKPSKIWMIQIIVYVDTITFL